MNDGFINPLFITDTVDNDTLRIQWVPREIEYDPASDFVAISSPGRNNSFFHFGGSDDTITLTLDWHSTERNREDVISNCRWLEAKSKNHGLKEGVHPVLLIWGNSLFKDNTGNSAFIVSSAKYTLTDFNRPHQMYPTQATQVLVLKRITQNSLTHDEIKLVLPSGFVPSSEDPDQLAIDSNLNNLKDWHPLTRTIDDTGNQDLRYKQPLFFNDHRYDKRRLGREKALEIAQSAVNYFANQTIMKAITLSGDAAAKLQAGPTFTNFHKNNN